MQTTLEERNDDVHVIPGPWNNGMEMHCGMLRMKR